MITTTITFLQGWLGADLDSVQCGVHSLQRRWGFICQSAAERRSVLETLWPKWESVLSISNQIGATLNAIEIAMPSSEPISSSSLEVEQLNTQLEVILQKLHSTSMRHQLDEMNEKYIQLARVSRVDAAGQLQQHVACVNTRWQDLSHSLSKSLQSTRDTSSSIHHWKVSMRIYY